MRKLSSRSQDPHGCPIETDQRDPAAPTVRVSAQSPSGLNGVTDSALRLVDLPPLPALAVKALRMVSNTEARLRDLHSLLASDQAFCVEILKIVNSPLYGIRVEISSITQAMMLLGFERVRALILTVGMRSFVGGTFNLGDIKACWRHSLSTALIAEEVAGVTGIDRDVAYTAGLMHNLGRLALVMLRPKQFTELVQLAQEHPCDPQEEERRIFGMDHCEVGRSLVRTWKLPGQFLELMTSHDGGEQRINQPFNIISLMRLSCALSDTIGFEVVRSSRRRNYVELRACVPARSRARFAAGPEELRQRITDRVDSIEAIEW